MIGYVRGVAMISYEPFYKTMKEKGMTEYQLIYKHGFSSHILYRMKKGENITLKTLDTLCFILGCGVADIIEYIPDEA
jgi:DNA-binding Xre family transcriptional regulator